MRRTMRLWVDPAQWESWSEAERIAVVCGYEYLEQRWQAEHLAVLAAMPVSSLACPLFGDLAYLAWYCCCPLWLGWVIWHHRQRPRPFLSDEPPRRGGGGGGRRRRWRTAFAQ